MNRLHPLSAVTLALNRGMLAFFVPFFLVTIAGGSVDLPHPALPVIAGAVGFFVGVGYGVAFYYRFGYELDADTFDISSGVIARRSREIPYRRIQNVDIRQNVIFQLLGLATVTIETAGGGSAEASLNFVSEGEATRLQREIRRLTAAANADQRTKSGSRADQPARQGVDDVEDGLHEPTRPDDGSPGRGVGADHRRERMEPKTSDRSDHDPRGERPPADDADRTGGSPPPIGEAAGEAAPSTGDRAGEMPPQNDDRVGETPLSADDRLGREGLDRASSHEFRTRRLFSLDSRELLLYSFASFRPAALAAVGFLFLFASDAVIQYLVATAHPIGGPDDLGAGTGGSYLVLSLVSMVHAVLITYFVSILYTFFAYYGFRLGKAGDDLVYERGLLQRYSGSIPLEKVQSVTVTDNPIQRRIDHAGLWVETAGYGPDSNGGSQSAVPLARLPRVHEFAERLTDVEAPTFQRPTTVARRRYLARYSIIATVVLVGTFGLAQLTTFEAWYLAGALYLLVPPAAHLRWLHLGYYVGAENLVIREGFWSRKTTVIPYYRIQTVSTRRSIFQRRLGLASLVVDTASSRTFFWATPTIHDVDLAVARDAHASSRERLQTALGTRAREGAEGSSL